MNFEIFNQRKARRGSNIFAALLLVCSALTPTLAKDAKPQTSTTVKVVGTMAFEDKSPTDMKILEVNRKQYLFVQFAEPQSIAMVDISKPGKLKIVSSMTFAGAQGNNRIAINGNVAVVAASAEQPAQSASGKSELAFWDISNPTKPRMVQQFDNVVRVLQDDRGYSYVLTGNKLSVVYDKQYISTDDAYLTSLYGG